jgi:exopolyphosphatase/guanosine-5'-triphosphate,3'-diphosphate pyrophosphatase
VAAVDCGTNSIRLLIARPDADGSLVDLGRRLEIVRLGQGVDATGEFQPDALARTFAAVDRYAEAIAAAGVPAGSVHFVATSAARDARNRDEFLTGIRRRLGVDADVISGDREAELSFRGALSRLRPPEPVLVMDIGGGSTELIVGTAAGIEQATSLGLGSVRLTERFLEAGPPSPAALRDAADYVDAQLVAAAVDLTRVSSWIGVAGTVTTLAAMHLGLDRYDRDRVHGLTLAQADLAGLLARLSALTAAEIGSLSGMHPLRADVITAGALIAARVGAAVPAAELLVSESDLLDGVALEVLSARRGGQQVGIETSLGD